MASMDVYVIERKGGQPYVRATQLASRYDVSTQTVSNIVKGIEGEIGKRYKDAAIIRADKKLVLVNEYVFLDYLQNRRILKDKNKRRYLKPFNPAVWIEYMGTHNIVTLNE